MISLIAYFAVLLLTLASRWFLFAKYGEEGWKGLVPFYGDYLEYGHCWNADLGVIYLGATLLANILSKFNFFLFVFLGAILQIAAFFISCIFSNKKSQAFGCGMGMTLLLIFFPFIANMVLAFGDSKFDTSRIYD